MNFLKILENGERYLLRSIMVCILLLIIVQSLLSFDYMTYGWNLVTENNSNHNTILETDKSYTVTLKLLTFPSLHEAKILVNGKVVTNFYDKCVTLKVSPGDEIAIDFSFYTEPIVVRVDSRGVELPCSGRIITCSEGICSLGRANKINKVGDDNGSL